MRRCSELRPAVCQTALAVLAATSIVAGARAQPRLLLIHADDAGMCRSVNEATIEAMQRGIVTSASIMVPCPGFAEFARFAASEPTKDFGVHLVLNAEWDALRWGPVLGSAEVPSLVDQKGFFWRSVADAQSHAVAAEVERELQAQIDRAREAGIRLSHIDSHMLALLSRPDLLEVYLRLAESNHLPPLMPRELPPRRQRGVLDPALHHAARAALGSAGLPVVDRVELHNYQVPADDKRQYFLAWLRGLPPGVSEFIVHCGRTDASAPGAMDLAERRAADFRLMMAFESRDEIERLGIELVTWSDLAARAGP